MPAQQKYLSSRRQRWYKVSAAILGGFMVAMALQLAVGAHLADKQALLITSTFLSFFLWVFFMIIPFFFEDGRKIWGIYLAVVAICGGIIYLGIGS